MSNKKRTFRLVDFAIPVGHGKKIKESDLINQDLKHSTELKETVCTELPSNVGKRDCKSWILEKMKVFRIQHGCYRPEYLEASARPEKTCCQLDSNERPF